MELIQLGKLINDIDPVVSPAAPGPAMEGSVGGDAGSERGEPPLMASRCGSIEVDASAFLARKKKNGMHRPSAAARLALRMSVLRCKR